MPEKTKGQDDTEALSATKGNRFKLLDEEDEMTRDDDTWTQNEQVPNDTNHDATACGQDQTVMPEEMKVNYHEVLGKAMDKSLLEDPDLYPEEEDGMTHPPFDMSNKDDDPRHEKKKDQANSCSNTMRGDIATQSDDNDNTQQQNQSTYASNSVSDRTTINVDGCSNREEEIQVFDEANLAKDGAAQQDVNHGATVSREYLDTVIKEETSYDDDRVVTL